MRIPTEYTSFIRGLPPVVIEALEDGEKTVKEIRRYAKQRGQPLDVSGRYLAWHLRNDKRVEALPRADTNKPARYRLRANQSP